MAFTVFDPTQTPGVAVGSQNINNILINGGFEFWQRGTTFTNPGNGVYTADRWQVGTDSASSIVFSQESSTVDTGNYSMKMVVSGSPVSKYGGVTQVVENYLTYKNKTVSFSARVFSSVASAIRLALNDGVTNVNGAYHTGGGGWETLTVSMTVANSPTQLKALIGPATDGDLKNGTYYFDSAMLVIGSTAVTFVPTDVQTEFAQCQRYYQTQLFDSNRVANLWYNNPNDYFYYCIYFQVPMRVNPTMTFNGGSAIATTYYAFPSQGTNSGAGPSLTFSYPGGGNTNFSSCYSSNTHQTTYNMFTMDSVSWTASAEM